MKHYVIGFILSVVLTIEAYLLATGHSFSRGTVIIIVLVLAIVQLMVQLFFFLHLDRFSKSRWSIVVFVSMATVVGTVVFGSLWVMRHLDYGHMHSFKASQNYIRKNEDL